jgi:PLP dependent protein
MSIADNLRTVHGKIRSAAERAGRDPATVRLVAVSKTQPAAAVAEAAAAGHLLFGENYVQELQDKARQVPETVQWHYIGALQSNKVKYLSGLVSMIHSVDRLSLALEIDRQWAKIDRTCDILLQVNISGETTKSGTTAAEAVALAQDVSLLPHLRIRGLMTMPPFYDEPERARPYFRQLRQLAELIREKTIPNVAMDELSMGMSGDFEVAVEEGATLVRVGSAIFGERYYG